MANEDTNIELRSEKVRNIIGKIPPVHIRYGISIVAIALLVLFAVSIIIPYRETVNLSITVHEEPDSEFVKSAHSGTVIIDTVGSQKDSVQVYMQTPNNIYEIYKFATKDIVFSVKNGQFVNKNELLFIVNYAADYKTFGITDITEDIFRKIKTGQTVVINIDDDTNIQGIISDIYANNPGHTEYRIKIEINATNKLYPNSKYRGVVMISEKTVFQKIFR
ncbi:MAG: hypothetical protein LBS69_10535 [Prevotellaceae bacterium]|jgi:hypothetical protein|nr:hypothetical protein [Prevotellaceae bacterium]